jgi:polyhydroxyalkanoate synthesis regulator phasin
MSELPIGTVHNGVKMAKEHEYRNEEITPEYLNRKMEGMMSALFDTLGESEERIKDLELQVWKLTEKLNGS